MARQPAHGGHQFPGGLSAAQNPVRDRIERNRSKFGLGMRQQAALRVLAFKWIRILHRCWVDRVPYDESRYLMALAKRGAPLLKHAARNAT